MTLPIYFSIGTKASKPMPAKVFAIRQKTEKVRHSGNPVAHGSQKNADK